MTEIVLFTPEQREELQAQLQLQQERASAPVWPTQSQRITQPYRGSAHPGLDIAAGIGDPIYAIVGGVVEAVITNNWPYGNRVVVRSPSGETFYYSHLSAFAVEEGQTVTAGQVLAAAGSTGRSTGSHLDLEIRNKEGNIISPLSYFSGKQTILPSGDVSFQVQSSYENKSAGITPESMSRTWIPPAKEETAIPDSIPRSDGDSEGIKLLDVGILGDVTIEPQPWWDIAAVGVGVIGLFLGVVMIVKPSPGRILEKILPAVKKVAAAA